jgi:glycosyltransferase involved in cell wall biosynthesis
MLAHLDLSWVVVALACIGLLAVLARIVRWVFPARTKAARRPFTSLLLVARNKEASIEGLVRGLVSCGQRAGQHTVGEIVVVDDRSTDQTAAILERLARRYPNIRTVSMSDLRGGIQSAVELGLFMCSSPVVVLLNLDGQGNPRLLIESVEYLLGAKSELPTAPVDRGAGESQAAGKHGGGRLWSFQGKERARSTSN